MGVVALRRALCIASGMQALPRIEAHVLDAGQKLLETQAAAGVRLDFIRRTEATKA